MCGIIGYIGKNEISVKHLLKNAQFNSYRGDDGIGIIYMDKEGKLNVIKKLNTIAELLTETLDPKRAKKRERKGCFEHTVFDKEGYEKKAGKFKKEASELLDINSNLIFLHHRKGTYGGDEEENLHPMKYRNRYYIHNGTAYGIQAAKTYLEVMSGIVFDSETDTEVIGVLYRELMDKFKDGDEVFDILQNMFPEGWGVLIEICEDGKVTVIKDMFRDLWLYRKYNDGNILISEPTPFIEKFDKAYYLQDGILDVNMKLIGDDYTDMAKQTLSWWTGIADDKVRDIKCDICGDTKFVVSTFNFEGHKYQDSREDRCFECCIFNQPKVSTTNEDQQKIANKKAILKSYLGDVK